MKLNNYALILSLILVLPLLASKPGQADIIEQKKPNTSDKKQIAIFVAFYDFHPIEYTDTRRALEQAGFQITIVSNFKGIAHASDNTSIATDIGFEDFDYTKYDAIIIIGGAGAPHKLDQEKVHTIINNAWHDGKIIGAICYAPRILAHAGILIGKRVTGWNDDLALGTILTECGAIYSRKHVVIDGLLVTADSPDVSALFAKAIVNLLSSPKKDLKIQTDALIQAAITNIKL